MEPHGHKNRGIVCVALTVGLLAAGSLFAQQSTATSAAQKPSADPPANRAGTAANHPATTHSTATHTPLKTTPLSTQAQKTPVHSTIAHSTPGSSTAAQAAARKTGPPASASGKAPVRNVTHTSQHTTSTARNRRYVPMNGQQRLARLHLEPERVNQIQEALIREGYLQGDTTGQWDARTREAMLRYQTDHGFPATGLPEAKSLMKLGLGSHPLPADLDHGPAGASHAPAAIGDTVGTAGAPASSTSSQVTSPPIPR